MIVVTTTTTTYNCCCIKEQGILLLIQQQQLLLNYDYYKNYTCIIFLRESIFNQNSQLFDKQHKCNNIQTHLLTQTPAHVKTNIYIQYFNGNREKYVVWVCKRKSCFIFCIKLLTNNNTSKQQRQYLCCCKELLTLKTCR